MKHLHGHLVINCKGFSRSRLWNILICISTTEKEYEYHAGQLVRQLFFVIVSYPILSIAIQCYPLLLCYTTECRLQQVGAETMPHHHHRQQQQQQQQQQLLLKSSIFMTVYIFSGMYFLSSSLGYIRKLVMDCGLRCSGI